MGTSCNALPIFNSQRRKIAIFLTLLIVLVFWFFSRYPALTHEVHNAGSGQLLERNFSPLSKDELLLSHGVDSPLVTIFKASINWMETNLQGMTFGFLFSAACLLLLEQLQYLFRQLVKKGVKGALIGSLFGMPLGVCTNCATPIGLGLKKAGGSNETAFATLISSPSLNPLGLVILLMLFPTPFFYLRLFGILSILLVLIPFACFLFSGDTKEVLLPNTEAKKKDFYLNESWIDSLVFCTKRYGYYVALIVKTLLPIMILVGIFAGVLVTFFPMENLLFLESSPYLAIMLAALLGMLMPSPMFVDLVFVWFLYQLGLPSYLAIVLLITMPSVSTLVYIVMGRETGFRLTSTIFAGIYLIAVSCGVYVFYQYKETLPKNYADYEKRSPYKVKALLPINTPYSLTDFNNFMAGGVSLVDFDQDGIVDLFVARDGKPALLKNRGGESFLDLSSSLPIKNDATTVGGIWGDYNNDGLPDLYLVNYQNKDGKAEQNILLKNLGNGTFVDVTEETGLTHADKSSSAAWADYDNDGDLDLFVSNYGEILQTNRDQISGSSETDRLYKNENGKFIDVALEAGVSGQAIHSSDLVSVLNKEQAGNRGFSFQPVWFDYDNDNLVDLFVSSDFGSGQLYRNLGNGKFKNVTEESGLFQFGTGMGSLVSDVNEDGLFDLLVSTGESNQVWINQGGGRFLNQAKSLGLDDAFHIGWGVSEVDLQNNGDKQFMIANGVVKNTKLKLNATDRVMNKILSRNSLYIPGDKAKFENQAKRLGLDNTSSSRGLAVADLNQDGLEDIAITQREDNHLSLYLSDHKSQNHFINIKLRGGKKINSFGVGAKVIVVQKNKKQHKLMSAGSSFASQNPFSLHFGLGKSSLIEKIIVVWPDGHKQILENVQGDKTVEIRYGA